MKKMLAFFALSICLQTNAQQPLSPGSIAIVAVRTDYTEADLKQKLTIVALDNIPANTTITFTDRPWRSGDGFIGAHGSDGFFEWTTPGSLIRKGTVVTFEAVLDIDDSDPDDLTPPRIVKTTVVAKVGNTVTGSCRVPNNFFWGDNNDNAAGNADQIIAFVGHFDNPTLLYGLSTSNWEYNADRHPHTSDLPKVLRDANCFVELGSANNPVDNAYFANGKIAKTKIIVAGRSEALLSRFTNSDFFYTSKTYINLPTCNIQVDNIDSADQAPLEGTVLAEWPLERGFYDANGRNRIQSTPNVSMQLDTLWDGLKLDQFPASYSPNDPAGIIIKSNTPSTPVKLSFNSLTTPWAANSIRIDYSNNGGITWNTVPVNEHTVSIYVLYLPPSAFTVAEIYADPLNVIKSQVLDDIASITIQIDLPAAVQNKFDVLFRISTTADPKTNKYTATGIGYQYSSSAFIIIDNIQLRTIGSSNNLNNNETIAVIDNLDKSTLKISPNPVTGSRLNIEHTKAEKGATISIVDAQNGRTVLTQALTEGSAQTIVSVAGLPKNKYYVARLIYNNREIATSKFFVQ